MVLTDTRFVGQYVVENGQTPTFCVSEIALLAIYK